MTLSRSRLGALVSSLWLGVTLTACSSSTEPESVTTSRAELTTPTVLTERESHRH